LSPVFNSLVSVLTVPDIAPTIPTNCFSIVSSSFALALKLPKNNKAKIIGTNVLSGAEVMATDLRASVCLVLAGLVARGETIINRVYHLERGYENLVKKLKKCGAQIKIINA